MSEDGWTLVGFAIMIAPGVALVLWGAYLRARYDCRYCRDEGEIKREEYGKMKSRPCPFCYE